MSVGDPKKATEEIISVICGFSGRRTVFLDQLIGRDLGIYGLDGVEILYELEERFGVDLDPLVKAHMTYLPPTWWDRLRGRSQGPPVADMTVGELVEYILARTREETGAAKSS